MAGRPGRSGGANRKTLEELQTAGTFKMSRHGHLLAGNVRAMPGPGWSPTEEERAELGPRALDRLGVTLAEFSFGAVEGLG